MHYQALIIALLWLTCSTAPIQKADWLIAKINAADTVILASHKGTAGDVEVDAHDNELPFPKLIIAGKPNYKILIEHQTITGAQRTVLGQILARPFQDAASVTAHCFSPHHAVFIIKNGRTSYLDICFDCHGYTSSKDLARLGDFDTRKWIELKQYFKKLGFRYEL
ncbi:hypothetical protein GCM10023172_31470 [Hymenobacter ginsengisoli]|uniref:Cytochrome c domain-containing protein n=1 Tax=Hymenobacter ginsengisoli TaxID=1051626 RepID=A0ABP8QK14_9BACT|nr:MULTISPECIES: hypothetical protein [unclassified Hymenobacter]MBO2031312.1 hypothetical protein [Hymenobacter sp. BT559]